MSEYNKTGTMVEVSDQSAQSFEDGSGSEGMTKTKSFKSFLARFVPFRKKEEGIESRDKTGFPAFSPVISEHDQTVGSADGSDLINAYETDLSDTDTKAEITNAHNEFNRFFSFSAIRKRALSVPKVKPDSTLNQEVVIFDDNNKSEDPASTGKKEAQTTSMRSFSRGFPPIQVLIGWLETSSRKDVLEHARGFAEDHIETLETAWIAMAEFRGGILFEIHEGGSGQSYLPELIEELSRDPGQVLWVPSGTRLNRVVTLSIIDERPFSMMLNEADSARVRESGQEPIRRSGRMKRLSSRGTSIFVAGATFFMISLSALLITLYLSAAIDQQPVAIVSYDLGILPHSQITTLSTALRDDRWVSEIVYQDGFWRAEFEEIEKLVLPDDDAMAQEMIDKAVERDAFIQMERDRRLREMIEE